IEEDCIWGADETGFQPGGGQTVTSRNSPNPSGPIPDTDGNCENITVIVTICADGDEIPPTVIYKGQSFSTSWHQGNSIKASVAHSKKGWTDKVLGQLWIQDFNQKTHDKANGQAQLLLVDGHNSHYTKDFLNYARLNNIHVLCYPAHATHIYQGLDVVVFGPLKNAWTKECDEFESSTRQKVMKANFISIYSKAHQKAITAEIIHTAFRVTGVWPFNPEVVTVDMMAPSFETSAVARLPLPQSSPVYTISSAIHQYQCKQYAHAGGPATLPVKHHRQIAKRCPRNNTQTREMMMRDDNISSLQSSDD
ncbi:DDE-domain-containing protein, partial [Gyrodon lividus]